LTAYLPVSRAPVVRSRVRCAAALGALLVAASALPCSVALATAGTAPLLLVSDSQDALSRLDASGVRAALVELQVPHAEHDQSAGDGLPTTPIDDVLLSGRSAVWLAHLSLQPAEIAALDRFVRAGGGIVASGRSGQGLEPLIGIGSLAPMLRTAATELRFGVAHPVASGSYWSGPISQTPPTPVEEMPGIQQLFYLDPAWPAFTAAPQQAQVLARWRRAEAPWFSTDGSPAVFARALGAGRLVYFGGLPGAYMDPAWEYPRSWRTVILEAQAWVQQGLQIELGAWPQGRRSAFAFTTDAERAAMATVVPALLQIFEALGLQRFGTFFMVGQAGGDPDSQGAVEHPAVVAQILAAGSELAGHGEVHTRFAGQDLPTQRARLQQMRALIEPLMGPMAPILGFRGPALAVDRNTYRALREAGLAYDSSDQDVWSEWTLPFFTGEVWQLPPSSMMDYRLLIEAGLSGGEWEQLVRDKQAFVASRRGLFNWVTHPWVLADHLPRVQAMLGDANARGDLWMARLDDVLAWWMQREDLRVELLERGEFASRIEVRNEGAQTADGASLWLRLPPAEHPWRIRVDGVETATVERSHGFAGSRDYRVLVLPAIAAGASRDVRIEQLRPEPVFADSFED
jgi:hypothetical protein